MEKAPMLKKFSKWVPKRWDEVHEQMVALSCRGMSNVAIATRLGYTEVQVSRVLNTPQALEIRAQYKAKLRKDLLESIDSKMDTLQSQAMENIESTLTNKELQQAAPFQMLKASMEFMKGVGKMVGNPTTVNIDNSTNTHQTLINKLPEGALDKLISGVERANRIMEIHSGIPALSAEIVDEKIA